ncbi:hypothetical protein KQX54_006131 [Cotesia glomerata]|uniref:Histone H4 n=1 Tax=Cotesia glomerata TaxID=32391 RepID=A0AAV7HD44_COTGL|nr:hypothetical protein KQX54_006131 [Cotesia glomerata]
MNEPIKNKSKRGSGRKARGRTFTAIRQEINSALRNFIVNVLHNAMINTTTEQRNTVTAEDIAIALTQQGHTFYGFDN